MLFYRNVFAAAFDHSPDLAMRAVTDTVRDFAMPGHSIEGFTRKAMEIAVAGIYDLKQHLEEVVMPVLRHWNVFERNDLGPDGEIARQELAEFLEGLRLFVVRHARLGRPARQRRRNPARTGQTRHPPRHGHRPDQRA